MAGTRSRTAQQLTYLLPGAALSAWLGTPHALLALARDGGAGWAQGAARTSIGAGVLVVSLFLYVLFYPALKGVGQPNYRQWRQDGELSVVIPLLTASMVGGWSLLWLTLARYTALGGLLGFLGALGIYLAVFGALGLIPVPSGTSARPE